MKKYQLEIKWAVIFALTTLLWMFIEKSVGLHDKYIAQHPIYTNLFAIPAIAIYVFALLDKRNNFYQGHLTYIQGLIFGIIISILVTLLVPLNQYIISTIITPSYFQNAINYSVEAGYLSQEDAEANFNLQSYIIQGLIGTPIMGLVTTAIVAIFVKKNSSSNALDLIDADSK